MADPITIVQKLIALAMNNPNQEEARSAAMKAVAFIVQENITLEGKEALGFNVSTKKAYKPDQEFEEFWAKTAARPDGSDSWEGQASGSQGLKAATVDTDLDDDFMRKRIKIAWRALQRERARLKQEIEVEYCQRFQKKYPRPEPVDWEK